ncbi:bifunctional aspartate kinase/diaminopimelate decarboxylase [Oleiagrimonas sp. C23AA]|uniref:bifunctional aspartate kinase/diaminopimelate decarboxylase n=1 Tax=Oleiagrimonas sp. C23AA TaxID=2719047 RepID=UPI001423C2C9|nr:bifunctional aspartate kinase/diaminopimelate decarboxylase [Oleiagrimonas sp. C23AA]NII10012.1 bifunctional aspartate kinase/diaminopimelate decarboxylase [Oleiagrimonas sp. C23AA]
MKFGGTSVATAERWQTIGKLAASRRAEGVRVLVVVSALAGVTDALKALSAEMDGGKRKHAAAAIAERHHALAIDMGIELPARVAERLESLAHLAADGPAAGQELAWQAQVQAHGELLSSAMGAAFLSAQHLPTTWVDSRDCLKAVALPNQNERTRLLSAMVEATPDAALQARLAGQGEVFIAQGFIARDDAERTVLLGRGGSDTSAAYFGALLKAARVEIWTDVAGMFSANPRQVPGARLLKRLDYLEAQEIASTGAKVLHPRCLSPLREPRVPLLIKDTNRPELDGTEIGPHLREAVTSVKAISTRKGITLVSMESVGMWQQVGFLSDVFNQFTKHGLSVDLIGSAETNVTVSLDPTENLLDSDAVAALAADLAKVCRVKVIAPCAAVTLVGRGMRSMLHELSSVLAEFGQLRVHLISQSSNNLNLTFVVDEDVVDELLPRLHELLLRSGSLRSDDDVQFGPTWQALYGRGEAQMVPGWWRGERQRLMNLAAERSPRYVYHLPTILERARSLKTLDAVDQCYYAVKANTHPQILKALAAEGLGLESVSPGELQAIDQAVPADTPRLFTPNFARREDYVTALATSASVTLDALHPIEQWGEVFAGHAIMLRVDLGRGLGHHEKVRTGGSSSKFGLPIEHLGRFIECAERHNVRIKGLHAHLGSGILDAAHWGEVYGQLAALADRIGSVEILNIGGGLGVPSHPGEQPLDMIELNRVLSEVKATYPQYKLWMEPGRYLVAESGVLLSRVTQLKAKGEVRYLGTDAGMHNLIRPALYDAWHEIVNLSRLDDAGTTLYQVVGPICESGDVLGNDRRLPETHEGDVMLIAQAGAYGAVMASHYNLRDAADEIVIE